jgi:hypothetical protein
VGSIGGMPSGSVGMKGTKRLIDVLRMDDDGVTCRMLRGISF